jgi:hypothetical protein
VRVAHRPRTRSLIVAGFVYAPTGYGFLNGLTTPWRTARLVAGVLIPDGDLERRGADHPPQIVGVDQDRDRVQPERGTDAGSSLDLRMVGKPVHVRPVAAGTWGVGPPYSVGSRSPSSSSSQFDAIMTRSAALRTCGSRPNNLPMNWLTSITWNRRSSSSDRRV